MYMQIYKIKDELIDKLINFIFLIFFSTLISNRFAGIVNISFCLSLACCIYLFFKNKLEISNLKLFFTHRKTFILFNIWCFVNIIFFTYSNFKGDAFILLLKNWRYITVIILITIIFFKKNEDIRKIVNYAMIMALILAIFVMPFRLDVQAETPFYKTLRIVAGQYITVFYPFAFSTFFLTKYLTIKISMFLLIIATFIFLFYIGLRGGIIGILIESFIALLYVGHDKKFFFCSLTIFLIIILALGFGSYYAFPQFQQKIDQTMNNQDISSSRDVIIRTRFNFIAISTKNIIGGIGYDSVSYNQYLTDHNVQNVVGYYNNKNVYIYNNDEPFFLNIFYSIGVVGLILFLMTFYINIKNILNALRNKKDIFNISFLSFGIGYFIISCSFEMINMKIFYLFTVLSIICVKHDNEKNCN